MKKHPHFGSSSMTRFWAAEVIAKYVNQGHFVHVAFLADGIYSRGGDKDKLDMELCKKKRRSSSCARGIGC